MGPVDRIPEQPAVSRLVALQSELGVELPELVRTLIAELDGSLERARAALSSRDLAAVALAAHAGRSSALLLDARPLLDALGELERAARTEDAARAECSLARLQAAWSGLRESLRAAPEPT